MEVEVLSPNVRKRRFDYTLFVKKAILDEQRSSKMSNVKIAEKYNINESTLRGWQKSIDLSLHYQKNKFTLHNGRASVGSHLEWEVCQYIGKLRDECHFVSCELIAIHIMKLDPQFKDSDLKKIHSWVYSFLSRNGYSIRDTTHVSQKPLHVEECLYFVVTVNEKNRMYAIADNVVINMDETPLYNHQKP